MTWRNHLTEPEAKTLDDLESKRVDTQIALNTLSAAISRIRNTCVQRARRKA